MTRTFYCFMAAYLTLCASIGIAAALMQPAPATARIDPPPIEGLRGITP